MALNIPKKIIQATAPIRYSLYNFSYRLSRESERVAAFYMRHRGEPMLVCGNGPSLNKTPLEKFIDIPSIGMNKIDLIFRRTSWRPSYIVCVNDLVFLQHKSRFLENRIPTFIGWKSILYTIYKRPDHFYFLNISLDEDFAVDISKRAGSSGTVTYTALQLAYFMGANPVILFGVDHSFSSIGEPLSIVRREGPDLDHFDPDYFSHGQYWGLPDLKLNERGYRRAKAAFEAAGRRIYDATVGGKLEIFPKISIEQALELVKEVKAKGHGTEEA